MQNDNSTSDDSESVQYTDKPSKNYAEIIGLSRVSKHWLSSNNRLNLISLFLCTVSLFADLISYNSIFSTFKVGILIALCTSFTFITITEGYSIITKNKSSYTYFFIRECVLIMSVVLVVIYALTN